MDFFVKILCADALHFVACADGFAFVFVLSLRLGT